MKEHHFIYSSFTLLNDGNFINKDMIAGDGIPNKRYIS